jgi:hypothetical protein
VVDVSGLGQGNQVVVAPMRSRPPTRWHRSFVGVCAAAIASLAPEPGSRALEARGSGADRTLSGAGCAQPRVFCVARIARGKRYAP